MLFKRTTLNDYLKAVKTLSIRPAHLVRESIKAGTHNDLRVWVTTTYIRDFRSAYLLRDRFRKHFGKNPDGVYFKVITLHDAYSHYHKVFYIFKDLGLEAYFILAMDNISATDKIIVAAVQQDNLDAN